MILTLKQMSVFFIASVFLGSAIVWGLKTTTVGEEIVGGGIMVEGTTLPLKLRMILNKTTFELNETVQISFSIENIGNETLPLSLYEDHFSFVVYDEAGFVVYDYNKNWGHPAIYISMPLPPNLSSWATPFPLYENLPPGRYDIVGQFISGHLGHIVETPPVTITIHP